MLGRSVWEYAPVLAPLGEEVAQCALLNAFGSPLALVVAVFSTGAIFGAGVPAPATARPAWMLQPVLPRAFAERASR